MLKHQFSYQFYLILNDEKFKTVLIYIIIFFIHTMLFFSFFLLFYNLPGYISFLLWIIVSEAFPYFKVTSLDFLFKIGFQLKRTKLYCENSVKYITYANTSQLIAIRLQFTSDQLFLQNLTK